MVDDGEAISSSDSSTFFGVFGSSFGFVIIKESGTNAVDFGSSVCSRSDFDFCGGTSWISYWYVDDGSFDAERDFFEWFVILFLSKHHLIRSQCCLVFGIFGVECGVEQ